MATRTMSQPESSNPSSFDNTHSSNSSSSNYTYHVFLSFRGADTRYGFTGHLYKALSDKGIHTFIDDEELRKGEEITPSLLKAIEGSRIAIVVLSKNYASSTFCLQELVKILECVKQEGRLVLPIFYGVSPSDVRHLNGSYGEAFEKHETRFQNDKEKVKKWKQALHHVSNLSGWHLQGFERPKKIHRDILHDANYPVGLESQVKKLRSLLDIEFNKNVIMVGIYGIGGVGKSTIARALYNLIADQFEGACFLANVREKSKRCDGLVQLQEQLLIELVQKNIKLNDVYRGIPLMKEMLKKKKVLLILDDVDNLEQLQKLAGGFDWFGLGSRIIITTRNKHLLDTHGVERKYLVETLHHNEALELLTWNAFKSSKIDASFQGILFKFLRYCNRLPLVLEVIGSNLFGKELKEWKSALDTYEKIPNGSIQKILKVNYDNLGENEKQIFLDIACFFEGCNLTYVQDILRNGRDLHLEYGVGVLIKRSLIRIVEYCIVTMHDLICDMGKEIVRQESQENPDERSRLWYYEDILEVFEENKGTDKIQVIMFNASKDTTVQWHGHELERMKNLRILIIKNAHFSCGPKNLPNSLRILDWEQYPSSSLPSDFKPRKLVILNLNRSCLITLDKSFQHFEYLRDINLSYSNLERLPSLAGAPKLRKIILDQCANLIEVDGSIGLLGELEHLSAVGCTNLRIFPEVIRSPSIKKLELSNCFSLSDFPLMLGIMQSITDLNLSGPNPEDWRSDLYGWSTGLSCRNPMFPKLDKIIKGSSSVPALNVTSLNIKYENLRERFPSEWFPCFPNLKELHLSHNYEVDQFLSMGLPQFPNLESLNLRYNNITMLPECIKECHFLRDLYLDDCEQLREIKGIPPNLKILSAINCISLTVLSSRQKLLSQVFHETGDTKFTVPGARVPVCLSGS